MEEKLIQVSFQLPIEALERFSGLVEQLRQLAAGTAESGRGAERLESAGFDNERFRALQEQEIQPAAPSVGTAPEAEAVQASASPLDGAPAVRAEADSTVGAPDSAGAQLEDSPGAEPGPASERQDVPQQQLDEMRPVRTDDMTQVAEAEAVRLEPESQIPEAEAVWSEPEQLRLFPQNIQGEVRSQLASPSSAESGINDLPETGQSRWAVVTEELTDSGAAPLTAESVSMAFHRDSRRYDNGFPLY